MLRGGCRQGLPDAETGETFGTAGDSPREGRRGRRLAGAGSLSASVKEVIRWLPVLEMVVTVEVRRGTVWSWKMSCRLPA